MADSSALETHRSETLEWIMLDPGSGALASRMPHMSIETILAMLAAALLTTNAVAEAGDSCDFASLHLGRDSCPPRKLTESHVIGPGRKPS
jgi:hypothetical protein